MSLGIWLEPLDPPLDTEALSAFIAQLPGARREGDRWDLVGGTARVIVEARSVTLAFRWSDNRYGHAAAIGAWLLARHRCRGADIDYGTPLVDNDACARHLARTACVEPSTPARLRDAIAPRLVGGTIDRIEVTRSDFVAHIAQRGALRLPHLYAKLDGTDDDDGLLLALYERLDGCYPIADVEIGWHAPLVLVWPDARWRLGAEADAPSDEIIWLVEDADGRAVAQGMAQEGAACLLDETSRSPAGGR